MKIKINIPKNNEDFEIFKSIMCEFIFLFKYRFFKMIFYTAKVINLKFSCLIFNYI